MGTRVKERCPSRKYQPHAAHIITAKPGSAIVKEFVGSSQLPVMDRRTPRRVPTSAAVRHGARGCAGARGLRGADVHPTNYGKLPIETPEGRTSASSRVSTYARQRVAHRDAYRGSERWVRTGAVVPREAEDVRHRASDAELDAPLREGAVSAGRARTRWCRRRSSLIDVPQAVVRWRRRWCRSWRRRRQLGPWARTEATRPLLQRRRPGGTGMEHIVARTRAR